MIIPIRTDIGQMRVNDLIYRSTFNRGQKISVPI